MRELLSNISLFVGQLYADKSLALRARDLLCFTTDIDIDIEDIDIEDFFLSNIINIYHKPCRAFTSTSLQTVIYYSTIHY